MLEGVTAGRETKNSDPAGAMDSTCFTCRPLKL